MSLFQPCHVPPRIPATKHFALGRMTLLVDCTTPHDIGNSMLEFLGSCVVATVQKVRPAKYTVRADVLEGGILCTLKVRVYQAGGAPSRYALELQRRSGCALAFQRVHGHAAKFLEARFSLEGAPSMHSTDLPPSLLPPLFAQKELTVEDVDPLLEMAVSTLPGLQAEAASLLYVGADSRSDSGHMIQSPMYDFLAQVISANRVLNAELPGPTAAKLREELEEAMQASPTNNTFDARSHLQDALFALRMASCHLDRTTPYTEYIQKVFL